MKFKVNSQLLPIKSHYFLNFAGVSPIIPYLPVFAKQLGFDEVSWSVVFAVLPFMGMLAKPGAGWIADRFGLDKAVFILSIIISGIFYFALLLVGDIQADTDTIFQCSSPISLVKICREKGDRDRVLNSLVERCPERCELICSMSDEMVMRSICNSFDNAIQGCYNGTTPLDATDVVFTILSNLSLHDTQPNPGCILLPIDTLVLGNSSLTLSNVQCPEKTELSCQTKCYSEPLQKFVRRDSDFTSINFWMFFIINIIAYSAFSVTSSMADSLCFNLLEGKHQHYGAQRVFGSIGWGVFTLLAGWLVDSYSRDLHGRKDYSPALYLMAALLSLDVVCACKMRLSPTVKPASGGADVMRLLRTPQVIVFVLWCTVIGVLTAQLWNWLPWYLSDLADHSSEEQSCSATDHGATWLTVLLSLNMAIQCFVGEVPMFFSSGWILKKLGHLNTMTLVPAAFGVGFLYYSFMGNPWYSLFPAVLNGVIFGIFYATMASYAHIIAPPGMDATMQGIVGGAFEGAGQAIGSLVGGAVYKWKGGVYLFRAFGLFSVVTCLLHALCQIVFANSRAARHSMPGNSGNGDRFNVVFNRSEKNDVADFVRVRNTSEVEAPILKGLSVSNMMEPEEKLLDGSVL